MCEWPQARSKRSVGKPSRQRMRTDALYEHISSDGPLSDLQLSRSCITRRRRSSPEAKEKLFLGLSVVQLSCSHNHWCTEDTLHALLEIIDTHMNPLGRPRQGWACLMDCAPKHISQTSRQNMESNWQDVSRCYIDGGFTSATQPLERAVMKPVKEVLRNAAAPDLAKMVVSDLDDLSTVMSRPGLKNLIVQCVYTALDDIKSMERVFQHAWSRLFVADGEMPNVLLRARELNHGGQLFKRQQCGIVPEVLPDAAQLDHQDVKDEPESDWMPQMMRMQDRRLQYWPLLHKWRSKHKQQLHRRMLQAQDAAA